MSNEKKNIVEDDESQEGKFLTSVLRKEHYSLSPGFESRLISRIKTKESGSDSLWLTVGIAALVITGLVAAMLSGFRPSMGAFKFISGHAGLFVFVAGFLGLLLWIERRWLRKPSF